MLTLIVLLGLSLTLCLVLTPLVRACARRLGLVDHPDGRRKIHPEPIPLAGGIAILLATGIALALFLMVPTPVQGPLLEQGDFLLGLFLAALVIGAVGIIDDRRGMPARVKLVGQLASIAIVIHFGLVVRELRLFGWEVELGALAIPFTVCWLLGAINSLNLIDGMDGMLTSLGLIICGTMVVMAVVVGQWAAACVAVALAGALLGFLRYNFPPATIFLGDTGSMLIGLVVGVLAIKASLKGPATVGLAAPVAILTLPFFDTLAAIVRRKLTGRNICAGDRGHLHHCLLRSGLSCRRALLWVAIFGLVTAAGTLASIAFDNELVAIVSTLAVVAILVVSRLFGYVEFILVKDRLALTAASLWSAAGEGARPAMRVHLPGAGEWHAFWESLTGCATELDLQVIRLDVNTRAVHARYHARWDRLDRRLADSTLWRAEIPLEAGGQHLGRLELVGHQEQEAAWKVISVVGKLVDDLEIRLSANPGALHNGMSLKAGSAGVAVEPRHGPEEIP
jgi:UDP-GlcNAc:undecaprenyl-phosphate GlcNAc-1-phosphate transferase